MLLPLRLLCTDKFIRKDGTSIIFIQYCFSAEKRVLLNSGIAIPPQFWNHKKQHVLTSLPPRYGAVDLLNTQLKIILRFAEDLVDLAIKKQITQKGTFVKEAFENNWNVDQLERHLLQHTSSQHQTEKESQDIYFQIDQYIAAKKG
ncbi:MAG: site-specific integrase, partial [Flavisolibacter sp.]